MDIDVEVSPVKLIYRPVEIERLMNFFQVEDLKPETRRKAYQLRKSLSSRFDNHLKQSLEMHELKKRKNKVKIAINCPVFELPFSNNPSWRSEQEDDQNVSSN